MDEIIRLFNAEAVRYMLIGGQAVRLEGLPRFSMDWDFYIPPRDADNIAKLNRLLRTMLDMPLLPLGPQGENFIQTYQMDAGIIQFHLGGPGLPPFDEAEARAVWRHTEDGTSVRCLAINDLLASKEKANRPQDQVDIKYLREKLNRA